MVSRRDGFWGIKIPGFFCPTGTYGMYEQYITYSQGIIKLLKEILVPRQVGIFCATYNVVIY